MSYYDGFFWAAIFWLIGLFLASFNFSSLVVFLVLMAIIILVYQFKFKHLKFFVVLWLTLFIPIGYFYYLWQAGQGNSWPAGEAAVAGIIVSHPFNYGGYQSFFLRSDDSSRDDILIKTSPAADFIMGERVAVKGKLLIINNEAVINFAIVEKAADADHGNWRLFFGLTRKKFQDSLQILFSTEQASFLRGLLLGERSALSADWLDKLSASGTSHLIALSGLHLAIISLLLFKILNIFWRKNSVISFGLLIILLVLFILMTGAKASAVRAAALVTAASLGSIVERPYKTRNALALAGWLILLVDPRLLVFDIGFQLSFLAVIGIVYLAPILRKFIFKGDTGLNGWRLIFLITLAAQLATLPLVLFYFGNFNFLSLFSNILVLLFMPAVMGWGYATVAAYYLFEPLARISAWALAGALDYLLLVVSFFSKFGITGISLGAPFVFGFYLVFFWLLVWLYPKIKNNQEDVFFQR